MARRSRSRFVRPAPRTKMWIGDGVGSTTITGAAVQLIGSLSAGALLLRPFTILRTHLFLTLLSDQQTAIETSFGTFGEIVVTDAATAIGATAIPDPSVLTGNPEADWFVSQPMFVQFFIDVNGTDGIGMDGDAGHHYVVDSKAMRKVGPDDDVVLMYSSDTAAGSLLITQGRTLIQLH